MLSWSVADAAGNAGTASFGVTVVVDRTSSGVLLDAVEDAGRNKGVERLLATPLKLADRLLSDSRPANDRLACLALATFVLQLHLLEGRTVDMTIAAQLSDFAIAIMTELGCPRPS